MRMTDVGIRKLKPKTQRYEVWEDGRTGLGVRVSPKNRKTFVYMYWRKGKARRMTLGIYGKGPNKMSLVDANIKHAQAMKALDEGRDPANETVEANIAERGAETVTELVEEYLEMGKAK
ncbi:MAG: Arm DNA-binding domain-containing protein [Alphaproteobacteria bacterium]